MTDVTLNLTREQAKDVLKALTMAQYGGGPRVERWDALADEVQMLLAATIPAPVGRGQVVCDHHGHRLSAWNCREDFDGPTYREQTCENPECAR